MSNSEEFNSLTGEQSNAESNMKFNKAKYQKEYMGRKRAAERVRKELEKDQVGEVSLASVEKESVVQTMSGDSDGVTSYTETTTLDEIQYTPTDAKFEEKSPGYWIYVKEVKERKCWQCSKPFETRLELNKFCGPKCKEKWLSDAFGKLKGGGK